MILEFISKNLMAIIFGVFFVITAVLFNLSYRRKEKGLSGFRFWSIICLVTAIVAAFTAFPAVGTNLGFLSTIAVAVLAGVTIIEARRLRILNRQDDLEKEERERKERLLNEIRDSVNNLNNKLLLINVDSLSSDFNPTNVSDLTSRLFLKPAKYFESENINLEYFEIISKNFSPELNDKIKELSPVIRELGETLGKLGSAYNRLNAIDTSEDKTQQDLKFGDLVTKWFGLINKLIPSLESLLSEIAKAKLALLKE